MVIRGTRLYMLLLAAACCCCWSALGPAVTHHQRPHRATPHLWSCSTGSRCRRHPPPAPRPSTQTHSLREGAVGGSGTQIMRGAKQRQSSGAKATRRLLRQCHHAAQEAPQAARRAWFKHTPSISSSDMAAEWEALGRRVGRSRSHEQSNPGMRWWLLYVEYNSLWIDWKCVGCVEELQERSKDRQLLSGERNATSIHSHMLITSVLD